MIGGVHISICKVKERKFSTMAKVSLKQKVQNKNEQKSMYGYSVFSRFVIPIACNSGFL